MTHSERTWRQFRALMMVTDVFVIILTYLIADYARCRLWMRTDWPETIAGQVSSTRVHMKVLAFLPLIWPAILGSLNWYAQKWRPAIASLRITLAAAGLLALTMAALALLLERERYPRAQIGMVALLLPATTLAARGITGWLARWISASQEHHVLVIGTGRDAVRLRRLFRTAIFGRPRVIGHLRGPWETEEAAIGDEMVLGDLRRLGPILDGQVVDEVVFCTPIGWLRDVLPYVRLCEEVGVLAHLQVESLACHTIPEVTGFHNLPLLTYAPARQLPELLAVKRILDILLAIVGIILTGPIMLLCAAFIRLTSPGPVLFHQCRSGLYGREFHMLKFRTMEPDAENRQAGIAHLNESTGPVFKITHDPRITAVGRILRRWSLDELPQLINVLKGDMSIVGPRPPIPSEVEKYDRWQRRRLSMRPGLTCLWQIKGRHRIGFQEWMELDLFYIDHWSLRLDFLILCRTISTVVSGSGA